MLPATSVEFGGSAMVITAIREDIRNRAQATPALPAVRFSGAPVTYGDLDAKISAYEAVMSHNEMSMQSAVFAALMDAVPALSGIDNPGDLQRVLREIIGWLGRDVDEYPATAPRLRAVG